MFSRDAEPREVLVRRVGTCAHCGLAVLLRVRRYRFLAAREASCPCGATVIRAGFFAAARLGRRAIELHDEGGQGT